MSSSDSEIVSRIAGELTEKSYAIIDSFLDQDELAAVSGDFEVLLREGRFKNAKIGKGDPALNSQIRGDLTYWVDSLNTHAPAQVSPAQKLILDRLEKIQNQANRELFLGIESFEGHYAIYPEGAFYKKHMDRFQADDARVLSVVLYLNSTWETAWGGMLRLYLHDKNTKIETTLDIEPKPGRLVLFLSDQIPHEVLTTLRERRSFTGWFKRKSIRKIF